VHGRLNGGFATCLALRLDPQGDCTIACAGHPAPFLNGSEIALPLGLTPTGSYQESAFSLQAGDHLSPYTDGLLEARSASGEIYGFDRLKNLFSTQPDAAEATDATVAFGQDDDITVLTLTRLKVGEESSARFTPPVFEPPSY
jgi:serine phosphatase RsbU (regulator of sigma subunit)